MMKEQKSRQTGEWKTAVGLGLSVLLLAGSILHFSAPSMAHVVNIDTWSVQISQMEEITTGISSNLLIEGGQTVLLRADTAEAAIPITANGENLKEGEELACSIKAETTAGDEEWLTVSLAAADGENLSLTEDGSFTIAAGEKQNFVLDLKVQGSQETVQETDLVPSEPEETAEPETSTEPEALTEPDTSTDTETPKASDTPAEEESEKILRTEEVSAAVTLTCGEQMLTAVFTVPEDAGTQEAAAGSLKYCPSQYDPREPIPLENGEEASRIGEFPAMTGYLVDGQRYLLYDGGYIELNAGAKAELDLSEAAVSENEESAEASETAAGSELQIIDGSGTHTVKYVELPVLAQQEQPIFVNEEGRSLSIPWLWGSLEPVFQTEQLVKEGEELIWEEKKDISVQKDQSGKIQISRGNAEAGTYRLHISWIENENTLYQMEIPFFIRYESAGH